MCVCVVIDFLYLGLGFSLSFFRLREPSLGKCCGSPFPPWALPKRRASVAQAMGGDVAWSWMPSPLNPVAYFCADLITIENDCFTSSRVTFNCITLEPSPSHSTCIQLDVQASEAVILL